MKKNIVAVVFDRFLLLDLAGPLGAFEVAGHHVEDGYDVTLVSVTGGIISASCGIAVETSRFTPGQTVDLMIVPGGPGATSAAQDDAILALILELNGQATRSASVCSGALLLAAAGILDDRRATTHWGEASKLRRDYPSVIIDADCIFIEDRGVWTSAGITAGIDLALAMIEQDHGFAVAQSVAQGLVVYHRRLGGQNQFSAMLELQAPNGRFGALIEWVRERLHEPLGVERLAERCGLSPRHFSRAFSEATGLSPAQAVEKMRVDRASSDIHAGDTGLEVIARRHGFVSAARMRRSFLRVLGHPPQSLKRKGSKGSAPSSTAA